MATPDEKLVLSVSDLNREARVTIEQHFRDVWVLGELSNFARPRSGHWYFTLKDERAQVRCAMFANRNRAVQLQPGDGQLVMIRGRVSLYEDRGEFQIIVDHMEAAGEGALRQAFDQLKAKLASEGLFATERKQPLPFYPKRVAVVTSATGAAFRDVRAVLARRYPALEITLSPCLVQGDQAEQDIIRAFRAAIAFEPDVILLTRGGGSLEDLWSFNSEALAREIFACPLPTVSAVGHEIDVTIADFVADVRAPTPSAAAELISPDGAELLSEFLDYENHLTATAYRYIEHQILRVENVALRIADPSAILARQQEHIAHLVHRMKQSVSASVDGQRNRSFGINARLKALSPTAQIDQLHTRVSDQQERLARGVNAHVENQGRVLANFARMLNSLSPLPTIERGYGLVRDTDGNVVSSTAQISEGDLITTYVTDGAIQSTVTETNEETLVGPGT